MTPSAIRLLAGALSIVLCAAHIGSPDVWFEGQAGLYRVRALLRMPRTVPGVAELEVEIPGARGVRVQTLETGADERSLPAPEPIHPLGGGRFRGSLWFMREGAHGVRIEVDGVRGTAEVVVPAAPVESPRAPLSARAAAVFAALVAGIAAAGVAIVTAAVREGSLPAGESPSMAQRRTGRRAGIVTSVLLAISVATLGAWWQRADAGFTRRAYRPPSITAKVEPGREGHVLRIAIGERRDRPSLLAEHGRLMHLFLLREPRLDVFAHLHPTTIDSVRFTARLPPLPRGRYRLIAEVVESGGFPVTMAAGVDLPPPRGLAAPCPECDAGPHADDGWAVVSAVAGPERFVAADGSIFVRATGLGIAAAGEEARLRFTIFDQAGRPARLEPYMGMAGHAVVARIEGDVFAHLHPMGTISMAAQESWGEQGKDALVGGHVVAFPYGFPSPGRYRVFVQVKRNDRIVTAAFDVRVAPRGRQIPPVDPRSPSNSDVTAPGRS